MVTHRLILQGVAQLCFSCLLIYSIPKDFIINRAATYRISNAVIFLITAGLIRVAPNPEPICPPVKTAISNNQYGGRRASVLALSILIIWPVMPARELTRINKAQAPAIWLALPQRRKWRMGARKIPPPMPVMPAKMPKKVPKSGSNNLLLEVLSELRIEMF